MDIILKIEVRPTIRSLFSMKSRVDIILKIEVRPTQWCSVGAHLVDIILKIEVRPTIRGFMPLEGLVDISLKREVHPITKTCREHKMCGWKSS